MTTSDANLKPMRHTKDFRTAAAKLDLIRSHTVISRLYQKAHSSLYIRRDFFRRLFAVHKPQTLGRGGLDQVEDQHIVVTMTNAQIRFCLL
jgi:hypothetical protein